MRRPKLVFSSINEPIIYQCNECTKLFDAKTTKHIRILLHNTDFFSSNITDIFISPLREGGSTMYICKPCVDKININKCNEILHIPRPVKLSSVFREIIDACNKCIVNDNLPPRIHQPQVCEEHFPLLEKEREEFKIKKLINQ